ncbi:MAG: lytic transglycosylase domain-containing protein [Aquincola sp.]|nr:lytic transglycosylase domain-containing protein [Aquincola sp.]MDH4288129.1 lytic transglycosylase domain-containing protein [Aquincola sp.]MDH5328831.1 lytic transglycosylase domain-containing protein [Aquincola sp.]
MSAARGAATALLMLVVRTAAAQADPGAVAGESTAAVIARNSPQAVAELCQMARRGDAESQYQLAWIFTHGRGEERRDDWASYLFFAASAQGHADAKRMLQSVSWPAAEVPECIARSGPRPAAATPATVHVQAPAHIERLVRRLAPQYKVQPALALAIIAVESNFDAYAVSRSAAMGLMQLIPQTAKRFGVHNAFDAQQNIRGGLAYLRWLLAYYQGDVTLVAAAYNAGEGAVDRHKGVPPFDETQEYVRRVVARVGSAPHAFDARVTAASPSLEEIRSVKR